MNYLQDEIYVTRDLAYCTLYASPVVRLTVRCIRHQWFGLLYNVYVTSGSAYCTLYASQSPGLLYDVYVTKTWLTYCSRHASQRAWLTLRYQLDKESGLLTATAAMSGFMSLLYTKQNITLVYTAPPTPFLPAPPPIIS